MRLSLTAVVSSVVAAALAAAVATGARAQTSEQAMLVSALEADARNASTLYATGLLHGCNAANCARLWSSTDSGGTWVELRAEGWEGGAVKSSGGQLWSLAPRGLLRSIDGGKTFRMVASTEETRDMAIDFESERVVVTTVSSAESRDLKTGDLRESAPLAYPNSAISLAKGNSGTELYVIGMRENGTTELLHCDARLSCEVASRGQLQQVLPSPDYASDGSLLIVSAGQLFKSTDRGRTLQPLPGSPSAVGFTTISGVQFSKDFKSGRGAIFVSIISGSSDPNAGVHIGEGWEGPWARRGDGWPTGAGGAAMTESSRGLVAAYISVSDQRAGVLCLRATTWDECEQPPSAGSATTSVSASTSSVSEKESTDPVTSTSARDGREDRDGNALGDRPNGSRASPIGIAVVALVVAVAVSALIRRQRSSASRISADGE